MHLCKVYFSHIIHSPTYEAMQEDGAVAVAAEFLLRS
jgi:hypothetical protein